MLTLCMIACVLLLYTIYNSGEQRVALAEAPPPAPMYD